MVKMWEEIFEQPDAVKRCGETNKEVISELVKVLENRNIEFVVVAARGSSDHAGLYGKYIIEYQLGIPTVLASPSIFTIYGRGMKLKNSLVIGLSQSGMAADVLEVIRHGNREGALTLGITNNTASPLAKEAAFHLNCDAGTEKSVAATKSFMTQMYLIAQLVAVWSESEDMKYELLKIPGGISEVLCTAEHIREIAGKYRKIDKCFVLARGINYPIALETALKMQETSYVGAKAYASSDFYHGPFAMIEEAVPVIVFAPGGPMQNDALEIIRKLQVNKAELIIVSNKREILEMGAVGLSIPDTEEDMISPFYNIAVAQIFTCGLALSKGLDPDAPRGLKKITVTR